MTTSTAAEIITDSLKEIGVVGDGGTATANQLSDGLRMLNRLLDTLGNDADFAYDATPISLALTGQVSFTVGPDVTADINTSRPLKISSAYLVRDGISYPVAVIDYEQYDDITYKALSGGNAQAIFMEAQYPLVKIYPYPLATGCTLYMRTVDAYKQFATTAAQIDMPAGYEDYIMLALAIRSAPSYGKQVNPETLKAYNRASKLVARTNRIVPIMELPGAVSTAPLTYSRLISGNF